MAVKKAVETDTQERVLRGLVALRTGDYGAAHDQLREAAAGALSMYAGREQEGEQARLLTYGILSIVPQEEHFDYLQGHVTRCLRIKCEKGVRLTPRQVQDATGKPPVRYGHDQGECRPTGKPDEYLVRFRHSINRI